jgi:hypothetical protein
MTEILKDKFIIAAFVVLGLCLLSIGIDWMRGYAPDRSLGYFMFGPVALSTFARSLFVMLKIIKK